MLRGGKKWENIGKFPHLVLFYSMESQHFREYRDEPPPAIHLHFQEPQDNDNAVKY